jgi:protein-disulfide isomerase
MSFRALSLLLALAGVVSRTDVAVDYRAFRRRFVEAVHAQRAAALKLLREQDCNCGCNLKIAECRVKDPKCSYSQGLGTAVANELKAGKTADQAYATLRELQKQGPERPRILEAPVTLSTDGDPSFGPANAKVTIVEFSDFQCPYCALAAPKAMAIVQQYPKDVRLVFKQFPLDFHSNAFRAAEASLAAHAQGKFWPLHDKMFANYRQLTPENILRWAQESGLDMAAFKADLQSSKYKRKIEGEVQEGTKSGVMGTPTFLHQWEEVQRADRSVCVEADSRCGDCCGEVAEHFTDIAANLVLDQRRERGSKCRLSIRDRRC